MAQLQPTGNSPPPGDNAAISQFLNPASMLTPGAAGAMTMMITNALAGNFNMPLAWVGLTISFVFGLLVLVSDNRLIVKIVFYLLNSLIIFCVAMGANTFGHEVSAQSAARLLVTPAAAQNVTGTATEVADLQAKYDDLTRKYAEAQRAVTTAQSTGAPASELVPLLKKLNDISAARLAAADALNRATTNSISAPKANGFFAPWKF